MYLATPNIHTLETLTTWGSFLSYMVCALPNAANVHVAEANDSSETTGN